MNRSSFSERGTMMMTTMGCIAVLKSTTTTVFSSSSSSSSSSCSCSSDVTTSIPEFDQFTAPSSRRKLNCRPSSRCWHDCLRLPDSKGGRRRRSRPAKGSWQYHHHHHRHHQPRLFPMCSMSSDQDNFWDQAEGKKKLGEIEDMRDLISEAKKLKDEKSIPQENTAAGSSDAETAKAEKLSEELARRAKEQAERRKQAEQMFQLGQRMYGRGMYDKAVEFLEAALTNIPSASHLGGEVQVWLAMAYEANNKHKECIALYKKLETTHPSRSIRRQAKDLRYILEAPKLKISKDEMVSIPLLGESDRTWSKMYKDRKKKNMKKVPPTRDYLEDWLVWKPPRWERSPYFWVAVTMWLTLVGISLMFQD